MVLPPVGPCLEQSRSLRKGLYSELSHKFLFYLTLTGGEWRRRKDKQQKTDMQKVGARCDGRSDGDAQQSHCFFHYYSVLLLLFSSLFFKALLLKSFFKFLLFSIL
jgi:hypothetical protein